MKASKLATGSKCLAIALSLQALRPVRRIPENALAPVADTAPGASKVDMLVATTREPVSDPGTLFSGERATAISMTNIVVVRTAGQDPENWRDSVALSTAW